MNKNISENEILITPGDVGKCLWKRPSDCNKGDFGYTALVGGSLPYSGAVRLAAMANCAMRAGAGVVSIALPQSLGHLIAADILEATLFPLSEEDGHIKFSEEEFAALCRRCRVIAFGMGAGNTEETAKCVEYLVGSYNGILVLDADGLNALAKMPPEMISASPAVLVLTPHIKEFSRLSGKSISEIKQAPGENAAELAKTLNAIVLLKGPTTYITDGNTLYKTDRGCAGMATAGSGDVLSGIIAAILGYNADKPLLAAACAAYINGAAGELAEKANGTVSMIASDTAAAVRDVIRELSL